MFLVYYFMALFCFIGFIVGLFESIIEPDFVIKIVRAGQCFVFAGACILIAGLI